MVVACMHKPSLLYVKARVGPALCVVGDSDLSAKRSLDAAILWPPSRCHSRCGCEGSSRHQWDSRILLSLYISCADVCVLFGRARYSNGGRVDGCFRGFSLVSLFGKVVLTGLWWLSRAGSTCEGQGW